LKTKKIELLFIAQSKIARQSLEAKSAMRQLKMQKSLFFVSSDEIEMEMAG